MKRNLTLLVILIVLTGVAYLAYTMGWGDSSQSVRPLADFAIEDTSVVTKVFIADQDGNQALLERQEDNTWMLNGTYRAMDYKVQNIMQCFQNIKLKGQVPKATRPGVIAMLAGRGRKVEIYEGERLIKTWYIGTCTQDHFGTYMLLETPEQGRSPEPVIMRMEGFTGCLMQRFFAWEGEWRHTGIFNYPDLEVSRVELINHAEPDNSFEINYGGGNNLELYSPLLNSSIARFDTLAVKDYLLKYKKVHFETFTSGLSESQEDSLKNALPAYTLRVTEKGGDVRKVDLFWKTPVQPQVDPEGNVLQWDGDRMYGVTASGEVVLVQRFTFDPLLVGISRFAQAASAG